MAGKPGDLLARVLDLWTSDGQLDAHPIADGSNFTERHPRLGHPKRARIHPQEENLARSSCRVPSQVGLVARPGIVQRAVDKVSGRRKREPGKGFS